MGGASGVDLDLPSPITVAAVFQALEEAHPAVGRRIRDETGALRRHVNVFVGPDNLRELDDLETIVPEGTEISILAAVSGG